MNLGEGSTVFLRLVNVALDGDVDAQGSGQTGGRTRGDMAGLPFLDGFGAGLLPGGGCRRRSDVNLYSSPLLAIE